MLRVWIIGIWWWFLKVTSRFTIAIGLVCIIEWLFFIVHWWRLLPRRLIICIWLLPPLVIPSLIHIFIIVLITYNIIVTTLIAKVRTHDIKRGKKTKIVTNKENKLKTNKEAKSKHIYNIHIYTITNNITPLQLPGNGAILMN